MILLVDAVVIFRRISRPAAMLALFCSIDSAQSQPYAGVLGGISTLSADAQSAFTTGGASASSYKPSNGGIANAFGGLHWNDYLSLQANYTWNQNDLVLFAIQSPGDFYSQHRSSSQQSASLNVLLYFRNRRSWVRPYLAVGAGVVRFKSVATAPVIRRGNVTLPPDSFSSLGPSLPVAVGIDLRIAPGWAFRYSFLEALQANPISPQLSPPGARRLANFQNLFGIVKIFGK